MDFLGDLQRRVCRIRLEQAAKNFRPLGLKPRLILNALRGAEAPLFHVTARVPEFFSSR